MLEELIEKYSLSVGNVRSLVDDYSLLSHYLGAELELTTAYSSPLRDDDSPSFSIFYGYGDKDQNKLYFKDHLIGSGDVYDFLFIYLGAETVHDLLLQINHDLELNITTQEAPNLTKVVLQARPMVKEKPEIELKSRGYDTRFLKFWAQFGITEKYLKLYNVRNVSFVVYQYLNKRIAFNCTDLTIAYPIGAKNKVYRPNAKKQEKFRNNYPQDYVEGHLQIDWEKTGILIITKSSKECIFFRQHFGINAVAGKSESTMIPQRFMVDYMRKFKRVIIFLDNDEAGIKYSKKYCIKYELPYVLIPTKYIDKDPTDLYKRIGEESLPIIKELIRI